MAPESNEELRDTIYIINKYDQLTSYVRFGKKVLFPYDIPVKVDYTGDPGLLSTLLQFPQLRACSAVEVRDYFKKLEDAKERKMQEAESRVAESSATEAVLEDSSEKSE